MTSKDAGLLTVKQFLEHYPMGRSTLYRLVQQGALSIVKIGRSSFLSKEEVAQWAASLPRKGANDNR